MDIARRAIADKTRQHTMAMEPSPDRHQEQPPIVPLDAPIRTTPIHPLLPDIRVPGQKLSDPPPSTRDGDGDGDGDNHKDALKTYSYNPTTCLPLQIHHHHHHRRRRRRHHGPSSQPGGGDDDDDDDDDDSGQDSEYNNDEQPDDDVSAELCSLRKTHPTRDGALQAQTQAALDAAQRIADLRRRREEVQRAMDKKVKERNTEMKVLEKYQEVKVRASDILPS